MKYLTVPALLAAALLSVVAALPFLPSAKMRVDRFRVEARLTSPAAASLQLFYDDGGGFREELTGRVAIPPSPAPQTCYLSIPAGTFSALRMDPPENGATLVIHSMRVVSRSGRELADLRLADFTAVQEIARLVAQPNRLEVTTAPGSGDPQLSAPLRPALRVRDHWRDFAGELPPRALPLFAGLVSVLALFEFVPRLRRATSGLVSSLDRRPAAAVAALAAVAVVLSAYPVVFLGKSLVSPNLGTTLLYDEFPTLPGYKSGETTDVKLSDVGAIMWQHVPFSMIQHRALLGGELPLWNRYNALGVPLLAQGQSMFGDPLHFLVIAANGAAWAWDLKYLLAKWLFATGLGLTVLALLRDPGTGGAEVTSGIPSNRSPLDPLLPALVVAAAAPFIGFFLYRVNHPAYFSLCYAPWPLYGLVRLAGARDRRAMNLWAASLVVSNLALMNSGTVKEAYMLLVCVNFSGLCIVLLAGGTWRNRIAQIGTLAWYGFLFVLLTMPVWATFLQTLKKAYTGYNAASAYQIQPSLLLGAFDEIFYRPLMSKDQVFSPSLNFLLLLGCLYFLATLRQHFARRAILALAASSLLPLALAFGLVPPQWIVTLPFLGNIAHLDNTFSCALIVLWSVVAGIGFAAARQRLGTPDGRGDLAIGALLLFVLVFGWVAFRQAAHRPIFGPIFTVHQPGQVLAISPFIWDYLLSLLLASAGLAWIVRRSLRRGAWTSAGMLVAAGCVLMLLWRHGHHSAAVGFEDFTSRPTVRANFHARSPAMQVARAGQTQEPARGFGLHGNFFPGWTGVYGLETVHGPDALVNPHVRELMGSSGVQRLWDWRFYAEAKDIAQARPFFDALNVRYYFDRASDQGVLGQSLKLRQVADLDVYESPTAWPRAFFADRVATYQHPADLVTRLRAAAGRPFAAVQAADTDAAAVVARLAREPGETTVIPATSYRLTENSTTFTVRANGPGLVVFNEAWWPEDFRAEINGRDAALVRVNHCFQGVVIDAVGEYRVTFRYWPRNFTRNLTLAVFGAALLAASLFLALRPARRA